MESNILCEIKWEYVIAIMSLVVSLIVSIGSMIITNIIARKNRLTDVITSNRVEWMQKLKDYISKYESMVSYYYDKQIPQDIPEFINNLYELTAQIKLHLNYKGKADIEIIDYINQINVAFEKLLFLRKSLKDSKDYKISEDVISYYCYEYPDMFSLLYKEICEEHNVNFNDISSIEKMIDELRSEPEQIKQLVIKQVQIIDKDIKEQINKLKYGHEILMILTQIYLKTEWERVKVEAKSGSIAEYDFDKQYEENKKEKAAELVKLINRLRNQ